MDKIKDQDNDLITFCNMRFFLKYFQLDFLFAFNYLKPSERVLY